MHPNIPTDGIGWVIALLTLVVVIVLATIGTLSPLYAGLFGALAVSRLV